MAVRPPILVIIGPTASGKSPLALAVAEKVRAEILSVDSMQVYRGMDVGTAKPTAADQAQAPHHLIDLVDANMPFTVARFVELADEVIASAKARNVPLVVTGGTPLYYKALFQGLFDGPGSDETVRQRLRLLSNEELHQRLTEVDPPSAAKLHVNDSRRIIRALEVHELTGRPISFHQTEWESPAPRHDAVWIGLAWDREALNRRINARVKSMIAAGWVDEVRSLLDRFSSLSLTASEATGYRELIDHIQGRQSLDDAIEQIKIATRQLARRQMKWFRRFPHVQWIPGDRPLEENVDAVMSIWHHLDENRVN